MSDPPTDRCHRLRTGAVSVSERGEDVKHEQVLGIVGGMGPQATADFMGKVIRAAKARTDQENIRMLVDCNPKIPPRVEAILHGAESPGPAMAEMARGLERWGADLLVIPCNTAHYYYKDVAGAVDIPVLNMIELTAAYLGGIGVKEVLLLGTEALLLTGMYEEPLRAAGIRLCLPGQEALADTLETIRYVKAAQMEKAHRKAGQIAAWCEEKEISQVILGCTELPMAFGGVDCGLHFYDPGDICADAVVQKIKA